MDGVLIRSATEDDGAELTAIYQPYVEASPASFELHAPSPSEMAERVRATLASHPWLVAERAGVVLGYAYASPHRARPAYQWSVDVSVYVRASAHRQGVGRSLYLELFALLRQLGYRNAFAGITLPNPASVGLHQALGFQHVGVYRNVGHRLGAWHDVGWWQLELLSPAPDPAPPTPYAHASVPRSDC